MEMEKQKEKEVLLKLGHFLQIHQPQHVWGPLIFTVVVFLSPSFRPWVFISSICAFCIFLLRAFMFFLGNLFFFHVLFWRVGSE